MAHIIVPPYELIDNCWDDDLRNELVNLDGLEWIRKIRHLSVIPAIQFKFPNSSINWIFNTTEERDSVYKQIGEAYGFRTRAQTNSD